MRTVAATLVVSLALAVCALAEDDMRLLFPRPQEAAGWAVTSDVETCPGKDVMDLVEGADAVLLEYNLETAAKAVYTGPEGATIAVRIYRMKTPEDAFGAWACHKPGGAAALELSQAAFQLGPIGGLWKGLYYAEAVAAAESEEADRVVGEFLKLISGRIEREGSVPDLLRVLDVEGFKDGSLRFLRTKAALDKIHFVSEANVLRLSAATTMALADYRLRERDFKAFVIVYPTIDEAIAASASYATFLATTPGAEAAWFKQSGKAVVGTWAGLRSDETLDSQDVMYETMISILGRAKTVYQVDR